MAVTRRGYIFCAFVSSILSVLLLVVAIASDAWVVSTMTEQVLPQESTIQYGLFKGEIVLYNLATPVASTLYMTCVPSVSACALSCKTEDGARRQEVEAMANNQQPTPNCVAVTTIVSTDPLPSPPVISFAFYICMLLIVFIQLIFGVLSAALAIINATRNPTEPIFGLPGTLYSNVLATVLGLTTMLMFGIYWASSGLKEHLAVSYIAQGVYTPSASLGFSYWILIGSIVCNCANVGLIVLRSYLLEKDPPPPTIKVENHSDGTIFLY